MLCIALLGLVFVGVLGFPPHVWTMYGVRSSLLISATAAPKDEIGKVKGGARVNVHVRTILDLIMKRYGGSEGITERRSQWTKMRSFLYRSTASNRELTVYQVGKVLSFLNETFPESIQSSILQSSPRILTKNVKTRLRPTVDFLKSLYGDTLFLEAVNRNPDLLLTVGTGYEGDELDLVEVFLRGELHLSQKNVNQLKRSAPAFFQLSMTQLLPVVNFMSSILECKQETTQKTSATIGNLIISHPTIFQLSVEENLKPRIRYLQDRCSLQTADLATLLKSSSGAILGLSVEGNLRPTIDFLSGMLSDQEMRKSLLSHPQILGLSLHNLRAKVAYFNKIDSLQNKNGASAVSSSLASRVLIRSPAVFSLSLRENIIPTVEFLACIWGTTAPSIEWDEDDKLSVFARTKVFPQRPSTNETSSLATLLSEYPSILTLSLHGNIKPTVNFYVRAGYLSLSSDGRLEPCLSDGKWHIIRGRYIAASLFSRILPRWHYHRARSESPSISPPLHVLAGTTDDGFCDRFGFSRSDYYEFKQEAIPRLKFSSQFDTWLHTGRPIDV